ncbi:MAG: glucosyl-3-phosphoglycerate synthase [Firmicutes bacterium]|nr:glucosyl-3-phosphoglycerate synthase [Bacillota bacterium]
MGTPLYSKSNGTRLGRVIKTVINNTDATVLIAQAVDAATNTTFLPEELLRLRNGESTASISEVVDKWFAENTFHASEFSNIEKLIELKLRQGLTISLGLPALNEEQTIGDIIETIKGYLYDRYPLLDEIAVIDSGSSDKTVEIAKSYGIKVFKDDEILPQWGSRLGKGCALWKSLYALKGDIIAWIDTDIKNIHPRFVYGLVGPILKYPRIKYVKGYYRRPVKIGDQFIETGGGRVTELTARPLLNLFFPELSGLVQPLSGEYAGRREVLEKVGFYNGYGVEMGLLINILEQFGLDVIGQVDLIERIHRNQSLENLSKMSFAIIQVVIENLEKRHRVELLQKMNKTMKLIMHEPSQFYLELKAIEESMKPPIATVPEYEDRFNELISENLLEDIG